MGSISSLKIGSISFGALKMSSIAIEGLTLSPLAVIGVAAVVAAGGYLAYKCLYNGNRNMNNNNYDEDMSLGNRRGRSRYN